MKKGNWKLLIPVSTFVLGAVFIYIGVFQLGFWDGEPKSGFFPTIISTLLALVSVVLFVQMLRNKENAIYNRQEFLVIAGVAGIIVFTYLIGMIPTLFIYVTLWLKLVEKAPWKDVLIILAVIAIIVLGVFYGWLSIRFPWGLLENIL